MKLEAYESLESLESVLGIKKDLNRAAFKDMTVILEHHDVELDIKNAKQNPEIEKQFESLPHFVVDGKVMLSGRYPSVEEVSAWFDLDPIIFGSIKVESNIFRAANDGRIGACCGVGTDVFLDPYEDDNE